MSDTSDSFEVEMIVLAEVQGTKVDCEESRETKQEVEESKYETQGDVSRDNNKEDDESRENTQEGDISGVDKQGDLSRDSKQDFDEPKSNGQDIDMPRVNKQEGDLPRDNTQEVEEAKEEEQEGNKSKYDKPEGDEPRDDEQGEESTKDETNVTFPIVVIEALAISSVQMQKPRFSLGKIVSITPDPNSWSNNIPKVITSCQVELQSEAQIEAILITKDTLSWTNICLLQESYITFRNFPRFASQLGPQIQVLKLDKFFGSIPEISFISCCVSLKSLSIIQMDVRRGPRMLLPSEFPNLSKTFGGVKFLSTENIYFDNPRQLDFFKNFLHRFPKLEHLYIPHPHGPTETTWETLKCLQSKYLIKPIIDYLNERHNNMNLPVNPIKRTVNAGGLFSVVFSELAQACAKNGAFITNVNQKQVESLFLTQDSTLGKILYLNDGLNDRRLLPRWINLEKVCLKTSVCDIRSDNLTKGKVPLFIQLKSIHLIFDSDSKIDPEFRSLKRLLHLLIGQPRATMKELCIQWPPFGHDTPSDIIHAKEIVKHFPNLLKFYANNWKAWDDELLVILDGLKRLQHLAIEDCPLFTEHGLLGVNQELSAILQLTDLKYLEIVNRNGPGSITDTCFERAFQHMPLKAFVFDVTPNLVTPTGYQFLTTGIFSNFIEIFPQPRTLPPAMTKEMFDELRGHFYQFRS